MRYLDLITEAMQPLSVVYAKMKTGFSGSLDSSCYNRVGRVLRERGDELTDAVVALYAVPDRETYLHAAIETPDGRLIDERQAPHRFRDADGRVARDDVTRSIVPVPQVLDWLRH